MKACTTYQPAIGKLKSKARLFKPTVAAISVEAEDYELGQYFEQPVEVLVSWIDLKRELRSTSRIFQVLEGDHRTILQNDELAAAIMSSCRAANGFAEE